MRQQVDTNKNKMARSCTASLKAGIIFIDEGLGIICLAKINVIEGCKHGVIEKKIHRASEGLLSHNSVEEILDGIRKRQY